METRRLRKLALILIVFMFAGLFVATSLWAAYEVGRPISDGQLNQTWLYGELLGGDTHYGLDWAYPLNTPVYAVADGTVVFVKESCTNGQAPPGCPGFGNYVVVRHSLQSWDRTRAADSNVYTIYAHLCFNCVLPGVNDTVTRGQQIAAVDDTGWSSGNHLHLQMALNSYSPETTTRNPELWLKPYLGSTGTVVGKLTDSSGNPIGSYYQIRGLSKPYGVYAASITYSAANINPDDILVENWGTTDVTPNENYHIRAYNSGGVLFRDLGYHKVRSNEVTYVDLYPFYLPDVRTNFDWENWTSYMYIRNNDTTDTTQVHTVLFDWTGAGRTQRTDSIPPQNTISFSGGTTEGAGVMVGSERSAALVIAIGSNQTYSYLAAPVDDNFTGFADGDDLGLARARTLYLTDFLNDFYLWFTELYVQNTGRTRTQVTVDYYDANGNSVCQTQQWLNPLARYFFRIGDCTTLPWMGSIKVSASEPLTAMTIQRYNNGPRWSAHNAFLEGSTTSYAPLLFRDYGGLYSGIFIRNLESTAATVNVNYYRYSGGSVPLCTDVYSLPGGDGGGLIATYEGNSCLNAYPDDHIFSARVTADRQIVATVNLENTGANDHYSYNAFIRGTKKLVFPWISTQAPWSSHVAVQNTAGGNTRVDVYFYNMNGSLALQTYTTLSAFASWDLQGITPANFQGSVVVESVTYDITGAARLLNSNVSDGGVAYSAVAK